jgi:LysR family transcriptional regulator, chromosome initiation inhibitor
MKLLSPGLQAFHAVAKAGTVHAGTRILHITQTALTRRIAGLEAELGTTLFLRSRRGMTLTDEGQALLHYCEQALEMEGETLARIHGKEELGRQHIVVQGPSSVMRARVIPALAPVLVSYHQLTAEYRIKDHGTGIDQLKRGECDILILPRSAVLSEFDSRLLKPERYVLVGPISWQSRNISEVVRNERIIDFDPTDTITQQFLEHHDLTSMARTDRHFANNTDALATMVESGIGYTVLSVEFATPLIDANRIAAIGGRRHWDYGLAVAWFPRRHMPDYFRAILKAIK